MRCGELELLACIVRHMLLPSVCHTHDPLQNGLKYRNVICTKVCLRILHAKFCGRGFVVSSQTNVLNRRTNYQVYQQQKFDQYTCVQTYYIKGIIWVSVCYHFLCQEAHSSPFATSVTKLCMCTPGKDHVALVWNWCWGLKVRCEGHRQMALQCLCWLLFSVHVCDGVQCRWELMFSWQWWMQSSVSPSSWATWPRLRLC